MELFITSPYVDLRLSTSKKIEEVRKSHLKASSDLLARRALPPTLAQVAVPQLDRLAVFWLQLTAVAVLKSFGAAHPCVFYLFFP